MLSYTNLNGEFAFNTTRVIQLNPILGENIFQNFLEINFKFLLAKGLLEFPFGNYRFLQS